MQETGGRVHILQLEACSPDGLQLEGHLHPGGFPDKVVPGSVCPVMKVKSRVALFIC